MAPFFKDPLLSLTRTLLRVCYWVLLVAAAALVLAGIAMAIALTVGYHGQVPGMQPQSGAHDVLIFAVQPPILALYGYFLLLLKQIIDTVAAGDPFVGRNADRLTRMAWAMVALKVLGLVADPAVHTILFRDDLHNPFDHSSPSLLFPLTLFILARVFRQGAAMRDDLEGTV